MFFGTRLPQGTKETGATARENGTVVHLFLCKMRISEQHEKNNPNVTHSVLISIPQLISEKHRINRIFITKVWGKHCVKAIKTPFQRILYECESVKTVTFPSLAHLQSYKGESSNIYASLLPQLKSVNPVHALTDSHAQITSVHSQAMSLSSNLNQKSDLSLRDWVRGGGS